MYKLKVDKKAVKYLDKLDTPTRRRILSALRALSKDPYTTTEVKRLKCEDSLFRKRVCSFRVIYRIIDRELVVLVLNIGSRGDIYK